MISLWDVLKASKGLPVSDFYAAMWGKQIAGKYTIVELEGALPLTFNANGEALIDYRIYGNTEQTGTPTPENPIMPSGCGVRTENLVDYNDVTLVTVRGTNFWGIPFNLAAGDYVCKAFAGSSGAYLYAAIKHSDETFSESYYIIINENSYSIRLRISEGDVLYIFNAYTAGTQQQTISICKTGQVMLTSGSTAPSSYIPYGYKLPILSNSTVNNIYLGEVETTRRTKKQNVSIRYVVQLANGNVGAVTENFTSAAIPSSLSKCNIAPYGNANTVGSFYVNPTNAVFVCAPGTAVSEARILLSEAVVWYILAEPETGIVNEPLMKIGDYADTVSMEQAGVSILTNKGTTVIDYDGTPKPSQMYIKYLEVKND